MDSATPSADGYSQPPTAPTSPPPALPTSSCTDPGPPSGLLLSDSLSLSGRTFSDLDVGCSLVSNSEPSGGIAGFERGPVSLPAQLNLTRFSYCLVSRRYDDNPRVAGSLVLDAGKDNSADGIKFTPFVKNPTINDVFVDYYHIGLNRITVGGKKVKTPADFFEIGLDGNGGVIIDSGTMFTYMEKSALVKDKIEK